MTVKNDGSLANKVGLLISYYITLSFWSAQTLALSMVSKNVAGQTKRSTVLACNFVSWAVGNAIGIALTYHTKDNTDRRRSTGIPLLGRPNVPHCLWRAPRMLLAHDAMCHLPPVLPGPPK